MILLTTAEARTLSALLEFGPHILNLMSEADRAHVDRARLRLAHHSACFIEMAAVAKWPPQPPRGAA